MNLILQIVLLCIIPLNVYSSSIKVNAWQSKGNYPTASDYPEQSFSEVNLSRNQHMLVLHGHHK